MGLGQHGEARLMALLLQLTQKLAHGFMAFYTRYPRKEARKDAIKAWGQVVKDDPAIEAQIHSALDWQIPHWQSLEWYTPPLPASYLRGERFTDEPPKPKAAPLTDEQRRVLARVQSNLLTQPRQPMTEAQMEIRKRLAGEWGEQ